MTVVQRLILLVLLAAIPIGLLQLLSVRRDAGEERREVSRVAARTAHRVGAEQRRVVEGARQMLFALSQLPAIREKELDRCSTILRRLQSQFGIYSVIGVSDPEGRIWCSSAYPGTGIGDRPYFERAITTRRFTTGGYVVGRVRGTPTLNFALPFEDDEGRLLGVLVAGLNLDRLATDIGRAQLPAGARLAIAGPDRRLLVHLPEGDGIGDLLPPRFMAAFAARHPGVMRMKWFDGSDRLVAFVPPAADRGMPFLITVGMDHAAATRAVENQALRDFTLLLLVVVAALLLAWWFATHYIRRPVRALATTVAAWRDGHQSARVGRLDPGSEFDDLGRAFDAMADAVAERERRIGEALESTTDLVATLSADWRITFLNGRARTRFDAEDFLGHIFWHVFPETVGRPVETDLRTAMTERRPVTSIFEHERLGGHFELNAYPASDGGLTLFVRDITVQYLAQQELRYLALNDPLTNLPNRFEAMQTARERARQGSLSALLLIDLDGFKHVNDRLGHPAGDEMLQQVACRLASRLHTNRLIARFGGDEFLVLLFDTDERQCIELGHALIESIADEPFHVQQRAHHVTASCGLVHAGGGEADPERLVADADLALYRAKAAGGATCRIYSEAERDAYEARQQLEEDLGRAIAEGEFELHYQPQIRLADGALTGAEALLRWRHPERGLLAPAAFIDVLESSRHTVAAGNWIIESACRQAAAWRARGLDLRVSVNLFAEQFRSPDLVDHVRSALEKHGLPPQALEVEITEKIGLSAGGRSSGVLSRVRSLGVTLAFDDFGTGFASFKSLKDIRVDRLKIDRGFVTQLPHNEHDKAIVEAILALARTLDLGVIAEGVETAEQEDYLRSRGCLEGQGYRYGRPMTARSFAAHVRRSLSRSTSEKASPDQG